MTAKLHLHIGHEGSNPQADEHVERTGDAAFVVRPQSEDGDSNYKFAFDVIVENPTGQAVEMKLTVDWQEPPEVGTMYMKVRRTIFVGEGEQFEVVDGELDEDKVHFSLTVPAGRSRVCLHPPYGAEHAKAFFERGAKLPGTQRIVFGRTAEDRPLEALVLDAVGEQKSVLVVVGRGHPYETAGSFCVDGVLEMLTGPEGEKWRADRRFVLVPVMNPDGVAHGLCKRTTTGSDITHDGRAVSDPSARSIVGLVCGASAAPNAALWDVHGWMIAQDGMNFATNAKADAIIDAAGGDAFPSGWRNTEPTDERQDPETPNFRRYAAWVLGMDVLVTSHPWLRRSPAQMRQVGAAVCGGFLRALG